MSRGRTLRLRLGRSWEDGPGLTAFLWSALLHAAALALFIALGSRPSPRPSFMAASVRIVGELPLPQPVPEPLAPLKAPEPRVSPAPEPPPEPTPEPRIDPPRPAPTPVGARRDPPPPVAPPKPAPKPVEKTPPEPSRPPEPPSEPEGRTLRGQGATARFEGSDVPHDAYLGGVVRGVSSQWLKPRSGLPPRPARVYFEIDREGSVVGVRLEESSGSALFDRSALRAVRLAAPLPRLPPAYPHASLRVHFDFVP